MIYLIIFYGLLPFMLYALLTSSYVIFMILNSEKISLNTNISGLCSLTIMTLLALLRYGCVAYGMSIWSIQLMVFIMFLTGGLLCSTRVLFVMYDSPHSVYNKPIIKDLTMCMTLVLVYPWIIIANFINKPLTGHTAVRV